MSAQVLTGPQAAKRLGISLPHLYHLIETKEIAAKKIGGRWKIKPETIDAIVGKDPEIQPPKADMSQVIDILGEIIKANNAAIQNNNLILERFEKMIAKEVTA